MKATSPLRTHLTLTGLALSLFVREAGTMPATRGVESTHKMVLAVLAMLFAAQLLPRFEFVPNWGRAGQAIEALLFSAANALALALCVFWFWIYFADRSVKNVTVNPQLLGRRQDVALVLPGAHTRQFILLLLPTMLVCLALGAMLLLAQLVFLVQLTALGDVSQLLVHAIPSPQCSGFGDASHRAFLAVFATTLGVDHECLRFSSMSAFSATLSVALWVARFLIVTVGFGVILQFGSAILVGRR